MVCQSNLIVIYYTAISDSADSGITVTVYCCYDIHRTLLCWKLFIFKAYVLFKFVKHPLSCIFLFQLTKGFFRLHVTGRSRLLRARLKEVWIHSSVLGDPLSTASVLWDAVAARGGQGPRLYLLLGLLFGSDRDCITYTYC